MTPPHAPLGSRKHPLVKRLREIRDGQDKTLLFAEGHKIATETMRHAPAVEGLYVTPRWAGSPAGGALVREAAAAGVAVTRLTEEAMAFVSDQETPPGVIAVAARPKRGSRPTADAGPWLILDGVQLPSNLGALLRVAEAAGAAGALCLAGTADPYGPKALRASAGSALRLPIWAPFSGEEADKFLLERRATLVRADPRADRDHTQWDWKQPTALLLGAEGSGPRFSPAQAPVVSLKIPMRAPVESLNVAVSAGIFLYEARRQREGG